jgi:myo-inositol-1(or 4)-monophosphatase
MIRPPIVNVMEGAAMKAARSLVRDFGEVEQLQVSQKGPADFVSEADRRAEAILRRELQKARPGFGLLMEESGETAGTEPGERWIVDPLDGTTNFLHGIPHFAISIAHESQGEIVAGLIYQPLTDESYWAERGKGAYLNNRRIRVSGRRDMGQAVLATGIPFGVRPGKRETLAALEPVMECTAGLRRLGAASLDLAYVAAGRYEAFWEFGLSPWDVAAGIVIVREAGGLISRIDGRTEGLLDADSILAANDHLHQPVGDMLRGAVRAARAAAAQDG